MTTYLTTFLNEPFAKVWVDEAIPCVFSTIRQPFTEMELDSLAEIELMCVKNLHHKYSVVFSITDLKDCPVLSHDMVLRYLSKIVKREFEVGLTQKFFVRPKNKITRANFLDSLLTFSNFKLNVCKSFEDALKAINKQKGVQAQKVKSPKSFFNFIFRMIR